MFPRARPYACDLWHVQGLRVTHETHELGRVRKAPAHLLRPPILSTQTVSEADAKTITAWLASGAGH
jgi:hypothetical protein